MSAPVQTAKLADYYFGFLKNLSSDSKLELISKLSESMRDTEKANETVLRSLFGAYQSDQTADELIQAIRESRVSNRNTETL